MVNKRKTDIYINLTPWDVCGGANYSEKTLKECLVDKSGLPYIYYRIPDEIKRIAKMPGVGTVYVSLCDCPEYDFWMFKPECRYISYDAEGSNIEFVGGYARGAVKDIDYENGNNIVCINIHGAIDLPLNRGNVKHNEMQFDVHLNQVGKSFNKPHKGISISRPGATASYEDYANYCEQIIKHHKRSVLIKQLPVDEAHFDNGDMIAYYLSMFADEMDEIIQVMNNMAEDDSVLSPEEK